MGLQRAIAIRSSEDVSGLGAPLVPLQSPGLALNAAVAADVGQGIGKHTELPLNPDGLGSACLYWALNAVLHRILTYVYIIYNLYNMSI